MGIGPEARRQASGRIVVVAAMYAAVGSAAVILGIGPIIQPAQAVVREAATLAIALGGVMLVGGAALLLRRGPARGLGVAAGVAMAALGAIVTLAAVVSLGECGGGSDRAMGCSLIVGVAGVGGVGVMAAGSGAAAVVSRARPAALRRARRQPKN